MNYRYIVLGAGKQGRAAAYDMALFGNAREIILADFDFEAAQKASKIHQMIKPCEIDVQNKEELKKLFHEADACLSAVPYFLNVEIAKTAVECGVHFCDLGGNTSVVQEELKLDSRAKEKEVSLVPDCGLAPGMANSLAVAGMEQLDHCEEVRMYCGGLPQHPKPPLDYMLLFSVEGLTNEYFGEAVILRDGKVTMIPTFTELEKIEFSYPIGTCEAFVTSGGTSTTPWTFEEKIKTYEYKTVRYPGHYEKIKLCKDLGLLDQDPIDINGQKVIPRKLFHQLLEKKISFPGDKDVVVLRVIVRGMKNNAPKEITYELIDFYDEKTQISAMERTTGFSASIISILQAHGKIQSGATPLETISGSMILSELRKRGFQIKEFTRV